VLLQVEGGGGLDAVKRNHESWWRAMFKRVRRWYPHMVATNRLVWLNVYGIPLHVWDEPLFKSIGSLFGVFDDFDEATIGRENFEMTRI